MSTVVLLLVLWAVTPIAFVLGAMMGAGGGFRTGWSDGYKAGLSDGAALEKMAISETTEDAKTVARICATHGRN